MKLFFAVFLLAGVMLLSCKKEPGKGGTSSISGKLKIYDINGQGDTLGEFYAMDEDVYIVYGEDDNTYDDRFRCSFDGSYRFDYLTPGKYTVYAYSRCDTCNDGMKPSFRVVDVTEKKTEYTVPDLNILK